MNIEYIQSTNTTKHTTKKSPIFLVNLLVGFLILNVGILKHLKCEVATNSQLHTNTLGCDNVVILC